VVAGDIPVELSSFVGRVCELRALGEVLNSARLVTIAGPGGSGKTRLAGRVAAMPGERWPDGARWVDLSTIVDPDAVFSAVASALGMFHTAAGDDVAAVAAQLGERRFLLVLDNCEHVLAAAADGVGELLGRCPNVTVLATSREPLRVPGEVVWRIPPLTAADSLALFHARAGAGAGSSDTVRTACARLEGMPLAIELAAAWSGTLSTQEILQGLDDRFRLLIRGPHGVAARHETLAASMDWSYELLDGADRAVFARLGVFHGGFTAPAAAGVCHDLDDFAILAVLRRLIDKSLLIANTSGEVTRYHMLETVREYALARLAASGEENAIRDRHLAVYLDVATSLRHLQNTDMDEWRAAIRADYDNHRAAIAWGLTCANHESGRMLTAELAWFWHSSHLGRHGMDLLQGAVALAPDDRSEVQARLLTGLALVADTTAPADLDPTALGTALDIATETGDLQTASLALLLSSVGMLASDLDAASTLANESETLASEVAYGFVTDAATVLQGIVSHLRDDHERAIRLLRAGVDGLIGRNDRGVASTALVFLSASTACTGDLPRARSLAEEAIRTATPLADFHRVGTAHTVLAHVEELAGRLDAAWAAIEPVLRFIERAEPPPFVPGFAERVASLHMSRGEPERALTWIEREQTMLGGTDPNILARHGRVGLADALHRTGHSQRAKEQATLALHESRQLGAPGLEADALEVLARLTADADTHRAEDLHHEALALRHKHHLRLSSVDSLEALAVLADRAGATIEAARILGGCDTARDRLGYPRCEPVPGVDHDARDSGRAMSLEETISYARRARGSRARPSTGWASLTTAERSVVELAADGLSNPDIGQRLFMSRATVKTHLSHVYAKLGIANRTQLATVVERNHTEP
jgi:predicted ATPase/DNA-binding CsgD family transcriptional regulator